MHINLTGKIHLQIVGGLQNSLLVFDPGYSLTAFNVECLNTLGRLQLLPLSFGLVRTSNRLHNMYIIFLLDVNIINN